jgi:hypothetical protein
VENQTHVELPDHIHQPFEVFVNGVPQQEGTDYAVVGSVIVFERSFAKEGKLGFWRWLSMFAGVAGTYRKNDSIDIAYSLNGRQLVSSLQPVVHEQA